MMARSLVLALWVAALLVAGVSSLASPKGTTPDASGRQQCLHTNWTPFSNLAIGDLCLLPLDGAHTTSPDSTSNRLPWTYQRLCSPATAIPATSRFCLFTNSLFHGNHGISIIHTPTVASSARSTIENAFSRNHIGIADPPYDVVVVPGKGRGTIANRLIRKGEVFMVQYAHGLVSYEFLRRAERDDRRKILAAAVEQLPDSEKESVLGMARRHQNGLAMEEDLLKTNAFSVTLDETKYSGLFPEVALMNHACNPNSFTRFSEKHLAMRAVAFQDIQPGEEITVSYLEFGLPYPQRQQALAKGRGFACKCDLCSLPPEERSASDGRRNIIKDIRSRTLDAVRNGNFFEAIDLNLELLNLVTEEGLMAHIGEHYEIVAKLCLMVGDVESADRFGRLALQELDAYGGEDVYESVTELRALFGDE